jgi:Sulfatase
MVMRQRQRMRVQVLGTVTMALGIAVAPQSVLARQPCAQIRDACLAAGFTQGGARQGTGLQVDCVRPILSGTAQPGKASRPLPQVDPRIVAACKAAKPDFDGGPTQSLQAQDQLSPGSVPPPVATVPRSPPSSAATNGKRPNIVFVLTDDLSWNLVPYMPHVVKMQKAGVTFINYFVTDSLCCPSRSSIFTGRYPHNTGIFRNIGEDGGYIAFHNRGHEQATFASALSGAGYRAAMLGKYLNGYMPRAHPAAPGWALWAVAGNGYPEFDYDLNQNGKIVRYGMRSEDYLTDVASRLAATFVRSRPARPS